jgi:hypothetical protein
MTTTTIEDLCPLKLNSMQEQWFRAETSPLHLARFTQRFLRHLLGAHSLDVTRRTTNQKIFEGSRCGAMVYATKWAGGSRPDEIFYEWHNSSNSHAFCCKWRGRSRR